jgi:RimJ/RimL family protein N-acetyltransferase
VASWVWLVSAWPIVPGAVLLEVSVGVRAALVLISLAAAAMWALWSWPPPRPFEIRLTDAMDGLRTERLVLRRSRPRDAAGYGATVDDEVVEANGWPSGMREAAMEAIATRGVGRLASEVVITHGKTGELLGAMSIDCTDEDHTTCELGWWLGPGARRQGYGTEAVRAVLPALQAAGVHRVRIGTSPDNLAVQRIAQRVGAKPLPNRPHVLPDGTTVESAWFAHDCDRYRRAPALTRRNPRPID